VLCVVAGAAVSKWECPRWWLFSDACSMCLQPPSACCLTVGFVWLHLGVVWPASLITDWCISAYVDYCSLVVAVVGLHSTLPPSLK